MPFKDNASLPKGAKSLPEEQQTKWRKVFNSAYEGTCKDSDDRDTCASKVAWSQVKKNSLVEFTMTLRSATHDKKAGTLRWKAVASDTDEDYYGDNMSLDLFKDFEKRISINEIAPEDFRSTFWQGGMPYLSVSHYTDLEGKAVPGNVERVFVDGDMLKAEGEFNKTPIGLACYYSICKDLYEEPKPENPVRVSIAFLDYGHIHKSTNKEFIRENIDDTCPDCIAERSEGEISGKIFKKGQLVHLALTRVPANERTSMEVEKSMTTRKEDAASIIGEELAEDIDKDAKLVGKSQALVIKSEEEEVDANTTNDEVEVSTSVTNVETPVVMEEAKKPMPKEDDDEEMEDDEEGKKKKEHMMKSAVDERLDKIEQMLSQLVSKEPVVTTLEATPKHELDDAYTELRSAYDEIKSTVGSADDKLHQMQEYFEGFAQKISANMKSSVVEEAPVETSTNDLVQALSQVMSPIANKLDLILTRQQAMVQSPEDKAIPVRRSLTPTLSMQSDIKPALKARIEASPTPKLREMVRKSVGLQ